jgi:adenylosuccinate synthase
MPTLVVVGAQWGDEGKGKIVDLLAEKADLVVRYQGGANAGHEVVVGKKRFVMHLIPSGILHRGKRCIIGNGVVLDPEALAAEIELLRGAGVRVDKGTLTISPLVHLTFPFHKALDSSREGSKEQATIGTTKRGIGPTYMDKAGRVGLRACDLAHPALVAQVLEQNLAEKNLILKHCYKAKPVGKAECLALAKKWQKQLSPFLGDAIEMVYKASRNGKRLLMEGAQGSLLDIDYGTYPFVSASNATAGGACTGGGLGPTSVDRVVGVCKAYATRVGEGPFPTQFDPKMDQAIREKGDEFGRTTGRARRCGWLDAVALRHAVMVNGMTQLAITKLDVLDDLDTIKVAVAYKVGKKTVKRFPSSIVDQAAAKPVYQGFPGWKASTRNARSWDELPQKAQRYLEHVSQLAGVPVGLVSVGPERDETILVDPSLKEYRF